MKVLVVCGAGASSTFLVHRMTRLAATRGLDLEISPGSLDALDRMPPGLDVVLVGSHLTASFAAIREVAKTAGVRAALLPTMAFDDEGAASALDLATGVESVPAASVASAAASNATVTDHRVTDHRVTNRRVTDQGSNHG